MVKPPRATISSTANARSNHTKTCSYRCPRFFFIFLLINGLLGINFGHHWDEHLFVEFADDFHFNGRVIPTNYLYPSFCYFLILAASIVFRFVCQIPADVALIQNMQFTLFTRGIFVCVASLCVIWVYILALKITKKIWVAVVAGLIFCSSFEFSYHSRWAVSDLIAVQFAILSALILFLDIAMPKRILVSAVIAGVAAGTKYTAGIVCVNIVIALALWINTIEKNGGVKVFVKYLFYSGIIFSFAFFLTTPGCVYHLRTFVSGLYAQKHLYGSRHLLCDTVKPGWDHLSKMVLYVGLSLFSKYPLASLFISTLCAIGTLHALLAKRWDVLGLFVVMFIYILYVSSFGVMIVRNLLYVLPYFTVLASYGLYALHERTKKLSIPVIWIVNLVLACFVAFSLYGVVTASWSIYTMDSINMRKDLALFLKKNPENRYIFSKEVRSLILPGYQPALSSKNAPVFLIFFKNEVKEQDYSLIGFNTYKMISGPQDVNVNYYPEWSGADRIMVIKFKDANSAMLADVNVQ